MKCVLIISQERYSTESLKWCMENLKPDADSLHAVYIMDEEFSDRYASMLAESTFVADKPGDDLTQALNQEYRLRAEKILKDVAQSAKVSGIACTTEVRQGLYENEVISVDQEMKPSLIVVTERKSGFIKRLFGRGEIATLKKVIKADMKAFLN